MSKPIVTFEDYLMIKKQLASAEQPRDKDFKRGVLIGFESGMYHKSKQIRDILEIDELCKCDVCQR